MNWTTGLTDFHLKHTGMFFDGSYLILVKYHSSVLSPASLSSISISYIS